jgi:hypothetical protein
MFLVLFLLVIFPGIASAQALFMPDPLFQQFAPEALRLAGFAIITAYALHAGMLSVICWSWGLPPSRTSGAARGDLFESAPVAGATRFLGDAAGIFSSVAAMHICLLPILAVMFIASPYPTPVFFWLELVVVANLVFGSASAAWTLRAETARQGHLHSLRDGALMGIMAATVILCTSRAEEFRDAIGSFLLEEPSPHAWAGVIATITRPFAMAALFALIYCGFIAYYAIRTIRTFERA